MMHLLRDSNFYLCLLTCVTVIYLCALAGSGWQPGVDYEEDL